MVIKNKTHIKMKKLFSLMAIAIAFIFTSCSEDDTPNTLEGKNTLSIDFDASFAGQQLTLGNEYTLNNEKLTINALDYIVGNFVLITDDGKEYVYPKEKSFFIISEGGKKYDRVSKEKKTVKKTTKVNLTNVPAGKYTKIKFGIGVDEESYKKGAQFANKLWERAEKYSLVWSWAIGYKFLVLEGTVGTGKPFKYHVAAAANDGVYAKGKELYKEITIDLTKNPFLVANDKSPQVHLRVDASKLLNAKNVIKVAEKPVLMGPKTTPISENSTKMFAFDHIHYNDQNH